ncbi:hypothetical protein GN244_ATG16851 [Phytophthora infestans]|uniref:Uncharacterized protein n=1 Tax=Phytophthora infestans TaxID=4787 RepID=A0A833W720_PHYIN|nr:hypothetical protein GN244_ATG16851 [Phytophthora infestans]KAF4128579.1 hypothetical protein GN958_ATG22231 [Phytophthora infestans]
MVIVLIMPGTLLFSITSVFALFLHSVTFFGCFVVPEWLPSSGALVVAKQPLLPAPTSARAPVADPLIPRQLYVGDAH